MNIIMSIIKYLKPRRKYPHRVRNFEYNGFMGQSLPGYTPYRARFLKWSMDPGIAKCECSDKQDRLIPSWAIEGKTNALKQTYENGKVLFGHSSHS